MAFAEGNQVVVVGVAAGIFGLAVGSFLNVVIYRVPRQMSVVRPGSHCPACGVPLSAADNVPVVSWLALRGRCRRCHGPISARYPLVEGATGAAFGVGAAAVGPHPALLCILAVLGAAVGAAGIAGDGFPVPPLISAFALLGAVGLVPLGGSPRLAAAALGAAAGAAMAAAGTARKGRRIGSERPGGPSVGQRGDRGDSGDSGDSGDGGPPGGNGGAAPGSGRRGRPFLSSWSTIGILVAWCAGWLWLPAGLIAAAACGAAAGASGAEQQSVKRGRAVLATAVAGALVALLVGAAIHAPR